MPLITKNVNHTNLGPASALATEVRRLRTERSNPAAADLDRMSALQIARTINAEDAKVAGAVKKVLPQIARAIDLVANAIGSGGRLIYVGAGTSGRIAALDASECPPTFGTDPKTVQYVIAGGERALGNAVEANEDSRELGVADLKQRKPGKRDVVVGLAASGRTPYTVAALEYARRAGAKTVALTCNRNSPLGAAADVAIVVEVGPEVLAGSSRMKAGTAQKMVLNMLTTGAMARLGHIYGNRMVYVHTKNAKLVERAIGILEELTEASREEAVAALEASGQSVPVALVMLKKRLSARAARKLLEATGGNVGKVVR